MVVAVDRIITNIEMDIGNALKSIDRFTQNVNNARKRVDLHNRMMQAGFNKNAKLTKRNAVELAKYEARMDQMRQKAQGAAQAGISLGMSMLFTGMAVKRFAEGSLRSITNVFVKLADENSSTLKNIMHVQAAFQYLKFVIMDTLGRTEVFQSFVSYLVKAAIWLGEFIQKRPKLAALIGVFIVLGIVLGTISMIFGQIILASLGLAYIIAAGLGGSLIVIIGILMLFFAVVVSLFAVWTSDMDKTTKILFTIGIALVAVGILLALMGLTGVGAVLGIIGVIGLLIAVLYNFKDTAVAIWGHTILTWETIFTRFRYWFLIQFQYIKRGWLKIVLGMAQAYNATLGRVFGKINTSGLETKIQVTRDEVARLRLDRDLAMLEADEKIINSLSNIADSWISDVSKLKSMFSANSVKENIGVDIPTKESFEADSQAQQDELTKQTEELEKLSGGSSMADLEEQQKETNRQLESLQDRIAGIEVIPSTDA